MTQTATAQNGPGPEAPHPTSLLIEGWRGVNHSYALVNQNQILELLKLDGLHLFHRDLPFAFSHWSPSANDAGFAASDRALIGSVPEPVNEAVDCTYRICSPFRIGNADRARRTITFMVTELGLSDSSFDPASIGSHIFTSDRNLIVTPTRWSRERIVEFGFPEDKVAIVPHGVDTATFRPLDHTERAASRAGLNLSDEDIVFINIGAPLWNKGVDVLLRAFAILRGQGRRVLLFLKDQRDVYGMSVEGTVRAVAAQYPDLFTPETAAAIRLVPGNVTPSQLRLLYGMADAYAAPYRAEGFNLPTLEAIACGLPALVTRGGATDDFCDDDVALRISGRPCRHDDPASGLAGRYIEPDIDDLVAAMMRVADGGTPDRARAAASRARITARFSWRNAALKLADLAAGEAPPPEFG